MRFVALLLAVMLGGCMEIAGAVAETVVTAAIDRATKPRLELPPTIDPSPELLTRARAAAAQGDCATVVREAAMLHQVAPAAHARLFGEPAIVACLDRARVDYARALAVQAISAARVGDCAAVVDRVERIARVDHETHSWLLQSEVQRCLPPS